MNRRGVALSIACLDAAAWLGASFATFFSGSDPATKGLDIVAGLAITLLFALTGLPALILAWRNTRVRLALWLALIFPAVFLALFIAVVISL